MELLGRAARSAAAGFGDGGAGVFMDGRLPAPPA
jgi:hypothetical protein